MKREEARARAATRCWSVIGALGGDRSCPILRERQHCRECDVITVAADDLLARPLHDDLPSAHRSALPSDSERAQDSPPEKRMLVVTFEISGHALAFDVAHVIEVGAARPTRRVPHRKSAAFLGLVNVQGKLEPCFSLAAVLGLETPPPGADGRLLVIGRPGRRCVVRVGPVTLQEAIRTAVGEPPATLSGALDTHVRGILRVGGRAWSWIDADRLLLTLERGLG